MNFFVRLFVEKEQPNSKDEVITQENTLKKLFDTRTRFQNLISELIRESRWKATALGEVSVSQDDDFYF